MDKFFEMIKEYGKDAIFDTVDESFSYIGYAIGGKDEGGYYVNNHLTFSVLYNDAEPQTMTKGFSVLQSSRRTLKVRQDHEETMVSAETSSTNCQKAA